MPLQCNLLGSLSIQTDGAPSELLKSPKGCALVAYLIATGQGAKREFLADLLWDASSNAQALRNLRALLVRIRDLIPELRITRTNLVFQPLPQTSVDLLTLRAVLDRDPAQVAEPELDAALQLYRGDLMENFYLEGAPRFEEWLAVERERLRQQVQAACQRLCRTYLEKEQWASALALAQRWVAFDPLNEEALRASMQVLTSQGEPGAGLRHYEAFRQRLWDELAVEPDPLTSTLAARLGELLEEQGQRITWDHLTTPPLPKLGELADPGPLPAQSVVPHPRNHDFTGRRQSLLHLASLLMPEWKTGDHRAAAITGIGGAGKTQLAVEFCYRYGRFFPGGVFWLNFAEGENVAEEVAQIGGERGMGLYSEADGLPQLDRVGRVLRAWQEPIPRLLIFDNCEEQELLTQWLPVTGGCSVLLTSRRALWSRELQVAEWSLPVLDAGESVSLLQNLVPGLESEDAARMAAELGNLPLALHLAGSFLRKYREVTAERYLAQLRDKNLAHPSLQGRGTHFSPTGHELHVARTFEVSWEKVASGAEGENLALELITRAAQFAPGVPFPRELLFATLEIQPDAWEQILWAEDGLARLVSLGLIRIEAESLLRLHPLVVAFLQTRIQDAGIAQSAVAQTLWKRVQSQWESETVLDQLVVPPAHLRYVMEVETSRGTPEAVHLTHAWGRHLLDVGEHRRARPQLERALAASERLFGDDSVETAEVLTTLGELIRDYVSVQASWPYFERAFSNLEQALGMEHASAARTLTDLAILHARTGDYDGAIARYEQTLSIYKRVLPADHPEITRVLYDLAIVYRRLGRYRTALTYFEETLRIREQIWPAEHPKILTALSSMGITHYLMGDYEPAYRLHQKVLVARETRLGQHHPHTSTSRTHLGITLGFLGRYQEAITHLQDSLSARERIYGPEHPRLVLTLTYLGYMLQATGDLEAAQQLLERGRLIQNSRQLENEQTAQTLTYLAAVLIQMGNMDSARGHLQHALGIWSTYPEGSPAAMTYICWGEWWEASGDLVAARSHYEHALEILTGRVLETHRDWQRVQAHLEQLREGR
jgi:DNA-binding SARP family transcriptional activator